LIGTSVVEYKELLKVSEDQLSEIPCNLSTISVLLTPDDATTAH
jgi:hypothetical protein